MRADLPHAPDEVLEEWLKPYAEMIGWPPSPNSRGPLIGRWHGILSKRPVAFWANVRWRLAGGPLEFDHLDSDSRTALLGLRDAHVFGIRNAYSEITDGKQRLTNIMEYVLRHGRIPGAVLFLESAGQRLSVIDGHHRLVAYFLNRDTRFRQALAGGVPAFDPALRKWIGEYE